MQQIEDLTVRAQLRQRQVDVMSIVFLGSHERMPRTEIEKCKERMPSLRRAFFLDSHGHTEGLLIIHAGLMYFVSSLATIQGQLQSSRAVFIVYSFL
jgi:hypothetical protein